MKNLFGILLIAVGTVFIVFLVYLVAHTSQECTHYEYIKELKSYAIGRGYDTYVYELENGDYYESRRLFNKGVGVCVSSVAVFK